MKTANDLNTALDGLAATLADMSFGEAARVLAVRLEKAGFPKGTPEHRDAFFALVSILSATARISEPPRGFGQQILPGNGGGMR